MVSGRTWTWAWLPHTLAAWLWASSLPSGASDSSPTKPAKQPGPAGLWWGCIGDVPAHGEGSAALGGWRRPGPYR